LHATSLLFYGDAASTSQPIFHAPQKDSWGWLTNDYNDESARARDERLVFCFRWESLKSEMNLAGNQGMWLDKIR